MSLSSSKIKISTILVLICCVFTVPVAIYATVSVFTPVASKNVALLPSNYATCPTSSHVANADFPFFPTGKSIPTYEMTFMPTNSPSWTLHVPKPLLQSDYKALLASSKTTNGHGVTHMVEPSNLLELITRMPKILADINLPSTITIPLVTQTFADVLAEIFNGKGHQHHQHLLKNDGKHVPIYSELVNVWDIAVLASDQAANLFDRNDKPLSDAGINPTHLRKNPFHDKRVINVHELIKLIRNRAQIVRQRMLNDSKLSLIQDIIERIDGLGYLFSNFNGGSESTNLDAVNSYAMSLRDFARSVDRHLIRLHDQSKNTNNNNNTINGSIRHKFSLTTLNRRYDSIDSLKQFFNRPMSTLVGGFAIDQQTSTTPIHQLTVPAVNGGPVVINRLNECDINSVSFKLLVNDKLFITVPSQVPNQLSNSNPIPHHVYQWTVPSDKDPIKLRDDSIKIQNSILSSVKSSNQISWRLEASSVTTSTTNCPHVPIIPYVFNGVLACQSKITKLNSNPTTSVPIQPNNQSTTITEQNRMDKAKCQTRCSGSCRSRCEDMCEDRCDARFGSRNGGGYIPTCSTCSDSCALTNPIMRRACSRSGSVTTTTTTGKSSLFSMGDNLNEQEILGDDSITSNDFDYLHDTLTNESLDDLDFSTDDGLDEDALEDFDFSIDDGLYEDTLDEADFAFGDEFFELEDLI